MEVIVFLFFLVSFFSFFDLPYKQRSFVLYTLLFVLFLNASFRDGSILKDYKNYVDAFNHIDRATLMEPTFKVIANLIRFVFGENIIGLFLVYALLGVALKVIAIRQLSSFCLLSLAIYISSSYILHEMVQIRAGVCASFLLLSIKPIYERNKTLFFFYAIMASLFHYSGLFVFLFWFISPNKISLKVWIALIPMAYLFACLNLRLGHLFSILPIPFIQDKIRIYIEGQVYSNEATVNIFNLYFLFRYFFLCLFLYKLDYLIGHNKYVIILIKINILSIFFFIITSDINAFAFRINELLGVVEIVLLPTLVYLFKPRIISKIIPIGYAGISLYMHYLGRTIFL